MSERFAMGVVVGLLIGWAVNYYSVPRLPDPRDILPTHPGYDKSAPSRYGKPRTKR